MEKFTERERDRYIYIYTSKNIIPELNVKIFDFSSSLMIKVKSFPFSFRVSLIYSTYSNVYH